MYRYRQLIGRHRWSVAIAAGLIVVTTIALGLSVSRHHRATVHDFTSCIAAGYDASETDPQTCSDGHATYVATAAPVTTPSQPVATSVQQDYQILVSGDSRGDYPRKEQIIRDQATWTTFWVAVHRNVTPAPPLLPVDFGQQVVIAITEGMEPTGGYGLELTGVARTTAQTTITYNEYHPGAGCVVAHVVTNNYLLVTTAKFDGPIDFQANAKERTCS